MTKAQNKKKVVSGYRTLLARLTIIDAQSVLLNGLGIAVSARLMTLVFYAGYGGLALSQ
jgi:hypothetical protein